MPKVYITYKICVKPLNEGNIKIFSQEKKVNFYTFTHPLRRMLFYVTLK